LGAALHVYISLGLAILICGLAIWLGDVTARRIGAAFLISWIASLLVYRNNAQNTDFGVLLVDIATLFFFVWASIRARLIWSVLTSAFQLIVVASHLAATIDLRVTIGTFNMSMAMWSYGILLCIAFGTWTGRRDRRAAG
jgi:hypothetical protein